MFKESKQSTNKGIDSIANTAPSPSDFSELPCRVVDAPYDAKTGKRLPEGVAIDGEKVISYKQMTRHWPYDAKTGERLKWGTKIDGKKVISYTQLNNYWPHDAKTGKKLEWGTKIDGKKVLNYGQYVKRFPYNAKTGEKLSWGTKIDGSSIVTKSQMQGKWPYDAITGERLEWGKKIDGKKTISYNQYIKRQPYDAITGKKLPWSTKVDGKKVISYNQLKERWPHDKRTGEKLEWGATGEHIASYRSVHRLRPTDKDSGALLPYGTPLGGRVVTRYVFSQEYTFVGSDKKTYRGEDAKAKALLKNPDLTFRLKKETLRKRKKLNSSKRLSAQAESASACSASVAIAHSPTLEQELNALAVSPLKDGIENELTLIANSPSLNLALDKLLDNLGEKTTGVAPSLMENPSALESNPNMLLGNPLKSTTEDDLSLIANSPTLDHELSALLKAIDTNAPKVCTQSFMPAYAATASADNTISYKGPLAKRHDSATANMVLFPSV